MVSHDFPTRARSTLLWAMLLSAGCLNAPVTGRRQVVAIPEQDEVRVGAEAWQSVQDRETATQNAHYSAVVERVGRRLAAVAGRPDYQWEFKVFASPQANAFALPGGKVAVYEGILPVCENEAGLAVVMSHEIAHVLARHGGERMTQSAAVSAGGGLLGKAVGNRPASQQERWLGAYGVASKLGVLLPYSRTHESEADSIGLTLMAKAGYDPAEAPRFWQRFARMNGSQPPEFLSTHPSDAHRAEHLRGLLPQALAIYQATPDKLGKGVAIATPAAASRAGDAVLLAGYEAAVPDAVVQTAEFSQVPVDEFLPPLERVRSAAEGSPAESFDNAGGEASPFPASSPPVIDASGWKPSK